MGGKSKRIERINFSESSGLNQVSQCQIHRKIRPLFGEGIRSEIATDTGVI